MSARRTADATDFVWNDMQFFRIHTHPLDGRFAIHEITRPCSFSLLAQHVINADADIAHAHEIGCDVDFPRGIPLAARPTAAMDDDDAWKLFIWLCVCRIIHVQQFIPPFFKIRHVLMDADFVDRPVFSKHHRAYAKHQNDSFQHGHLCFFHICNKSCLHEIIPLFFRFPPILLII